MPHVVPGFPCLICSAHCSVVVGFRVLKGLLFEADGTVSAGILRELAFCSGASLFELTIPTEVQTK